MSRGYTFVELLMSLSILTIGVGGVVAMQKVTVTSNQHAKNLALATAVSQAWVDELNADAVQWNHPSAERATSDLASDTTWLGAVQGQAQDWFLPSYSDARSFGPGFDAQGAPVDTTDDDAAANARFCTHLRLSWLYPEATPVVGNGLIRIEVRVFWLREGQPSLGGVDLCSSAVADVGAATDRYHFVYAVSAARQNTARR